VNFLAHFHLAWPDEDLVAGGLEGDYHKGPVDASLSRGLQRGVRLHRAIDAFTDSHPALADLRREFDPRLRRFAGILVDLSFDHFLSSHWSRFADQPLNQFNHSVYRGLQGRRRELSAPARRMLDRLVQYDLLGRYSEWTAVPDSAARIGERFARGNPFIDIGDELQRMRPRLEAAFLTFYPELQAFAQVRRTALNPFPATASNVAFDAKNP
jgi:acyl carrier protein phosphodiesterase